MTIYSQRSVPKTSASSIIPASKPLAAPPMDDNLFDDINWPEDDEMEYFAANCRESSVVMARGSEHEPSDRRSGWNAKAGSEKSSTPSATSGESCSFEDVPQSRVGACAGSGGCRFSKEARSVLRTWYHEHRENPYPSSEEKDDLVTQTGLKRSQISLWLANTRRKDRARANQRQSAAAAPPQQRSFGEMNPLDRWKVTPIELEAVSPPVILAACEDNPLKPLDSIDEEFNNYPSSLFADEQSIANFSQYDAYWAQSMASYETGFTSMIGGSSISDNTSFSYSSLNPSFNQMGARERRRRRVNSNKPPKPTAKAKARPFQCTFCPDSTFTTKHDWQRHEKSQHLSLETWICCLSGGTIDSPSGPLCAFCDCPNPSKQHLETHNLSACQMKEPSERTFYRKDHFQQHLRLTHECKINPRMEVWKSEISDVKSRCGFCSATFSTWAARAEHLASHFKCRATMQDWVGDWGFEPHIAALVERAPSAALLLEPLGGFHPTPKVAAFNTAHMPPPPLLSQDLTAVNYQHGGQAFYPDPLVDFGNSLTDSTMAFNNDPGLMGFGATDAVDWSQFTA